MDYRKSNRVLFSETLKRFQLLQKSHTLKFNLEVTFVHIKLEVISIHEEKKPSGLGITIKFRVRKTFFPL